MKPPTRRRAWRAAALCAVVAAGACGTTPEESAVRSAPGHGPERNGAVAASRNVAPPAIERKRRAIAEPGGPLAPADAALYDDASPALRLLQQSEDALRELPRDAQGGVDWVRALNRALIQPRAAVKETGAMRVRDTRIVMRRTREMDYVEFPHRPHTEWLDCGNCHPAIFREVAGGHEITMTDLFEGRYCGLCHDRVAFSAYACERCHSVARPENRNAGS